MVVLEDARRVGCLGRLAQAGDPRRAVAIEEFRAAERLLAVGGDDGVVVVDRVQPSDNYVTGPYWGRAMDSVIGRKTIGVAIKYK